MDPSVPRRQVVTRTVTALLALGVWVACASGPDPVAEGAPRVAFFGSSTIAGVGASGVDRRWSTLISRELGWRELNLGLAGSKLTAVPARILAGERRLGQVITRLPDVIVLMYGANDVAARVPIGDAATPGTFHHAVAGVLGGLRAALPHTTLVVCSPQPAAALAEGRAAYDAVLEREAAAAGALYVPAERAFPAERLAALAADRIHLNDAGHRALAAFVAGRLGPALAAGGIPIGTDLALAAGVP